MRPEHVRALNGPTTEVPRLLHEIQRLSEQYNQLAQAMASLAPEQNGERGGLLLQMVLTRVAALDLKVDLIAARVLPDVTQGQSRIVVPQ